MRNFYPKLAVPLLFAFSACATSQSNKPPVSESTAETKTIDTVKIPTDSGSSEQIAVAIKQDTAMPTQKQIAAPKAATIKGSVVKSRLPDLPVPPHFENEEVNKGVQEFAGMIRENMIAEQNHDSVKMKALKTQMNGLPTNMAIWIFNMSADERKSFKAYLEQIEKIAEDSKDNQQQNS